MCKLYFIFICKLYFIFICKIYILEKYSIQLAVKNPKRSKEVWRNLYRSYRSSKVYSFVVVDVLGFMERFIGLKYFIFYEKI